MKISERMVGTGLRMGKVGVAALLLAGLAGSAPAAPGQVLKGSVIQMRRPMQMSPVTPAMEARFAKFEGELQPVAKSWVEQQGRAEMRKPAVDYKGLETAVRGRFKACPQGTAPKPNPAVAARSTAAVACLSPAGYYDFVFLVLVQAVHTEQSDIDRMTADLKAETAKQKRDILGFISKAESLVFPRDANAKQGRGAEPCTVNGCRMVQDLAMQIMKMTEGSSHPLHYVLPAQLTYGQAAQLIAQMKQDVPTISDLTAKQMDELHKAEERQPQFGRLLGDIFHQVTDTTGAEVQGLK